MTEPTTAQCFEVAKLILKYCDDDWAIGRLMDDLGLTEEEARHWLSEARSKLPH